MIDKPTWLDGLIHTIEKGLTFTKRHYMCRHINWFQKIYKAAGDAGKHAEPQWDYEGAKGAMQMAVNDEMNWN